MTGTGNHIAGQKAGKSTKKKMCEYGRVGSPAFAEWICARPRGWNCCHGKPGPVIQLGYGLGGGICVNPVAMSPFRSLEKCPLAAVRPHK